MTLRDLKPGHIATVDRVLGEDALMCRIMDMGITKGTQLTAKCCAPFGDPMMIELRGYCLMIIHKDAERVLIDDVRRCPYADGGQRRHRHRDCCGDGRTL